MTLIARLIDVVLQLDVHLAAFIADIGLPTTYAVIFFIIVGETGLVVAPFLPGDSLLFAAGALSARGLLSVWLLLPLLWLAAVAGDSLNYALGKHIGVKAFRKDSRFLNHGHLEQTRAFFKRHGGKSIVLARFLPFVRTGAPFIAGVSHMPYGLFLLYNVVGGAIWVGLFVLGGYFFGQIPAVEENFSLVILTIIAFSAVPATITWARSHFKSA